MKCAFCIVTRMLGKDIITSQPILEALAMAAEAVTVVKGKAMCIEHLHQHLRESIEAKNSDPLGS